MGGTAEQDEIRPSQTRHGHVSAGEERDAQKTKGTRDVGVGDAQEIHAATGRKRK